MHLWGPVIQRLPGARQNTLVGGYTVPEIAYVDLCVLLRQRSLPCYDRHLAECGKPRNLDKIPRATLTGKPLHPYQILDAGRLYAHSAGVFHEPGLGKSRIAAAALYAMMRDGLTTGAVWLQPNATIDQIRIELAEEWGITAAPIETAKGGEAVLLVNYEKLQLRLDYASEIVCHVAAGAKVVICDEIHRAGNANQASQTLLRLRFQTPYRWALSGTPIQNRAKSFFRPYLWITKADLTEQAWIAKFCIKETGKDRPGALAHLSPLIQSIAARRLKRDVAPDLEDITIEIRKVRLHDRQRELYRQFAQGYIDEIRKMADLPRDLWSREPFVRAIRLRQVCNDPYLLLGDTESKRNAKADALGQILDELEGHKVVIWSGHPRILQRVAMTYGGVEYHGEVEKEDRDLARRKFMEDPACRLFCANYSVAGTGLDGLQKVASHAIVLDLPDQEVMWQQLMDRLHRIGQEDPVTIYLLLAQGTIEMDHWARIREKAKNSRTMLGDEGTRPASLNWADLERYLTVDNL